MAKESKKEVVQKLTADLLEKLSVAATVTVVDAAEEGMSVNIDTQESGLLIGYHGETLNSLQLLLSMMLFQTYNEWIRIVVNIGDYREKREETIKSLALRVASEVALTKQPTPLPYLVPFERRIVHMTLVDHPSVISVSEGEGRERRVMVKPK